MRLRSALFVCAALLFTWTLAGCDVLGAGTSKGASADSRNTLVAESTKLPQPSPSSPAPTPTRSIAPAAAAGGVCRGLSYDAVAVAIGVRFDVAAASGGLGSEQVCVLQRTGANAPDLTLSVLSTTSDAESFKLDFQPKGAKEIPGLGLAAYSHAPAGGQAGRPTVEVGWLTKKKLCTLTFTGTAATSSTTLQKLIPGLVKLAKALPK
jgi:hypothetical protein